MAVLVLDRHKKPLTPCSTKHARKLLAAGRARVHRLFPFAIRLIDRTVGHSTLQPVAVKLDPDSKNSGIALVRQSEKLDAHTGKIQACAHVLCLFELIHRGRQINVALTARRNLRRRRRSTLRYRAPRFLNRGNKQKGWLAPSLQHRIDTTLAWVKRLCKLAPVTSLFQELVRFDMQKMKNSEITGIQYQQGTLPGFEVREYLLAKWNRHCSYCDVKDVPLQIDHIHPKARGGSNRVSNLTLACRSCNQNKGADDIKVFLAKDPVRLARILARAKRPLKDAAAVNATRWELLGALKATGLPMVTGSGGQTKFNRTRLGIPKTHALDAACVGAVDTVLDWKRPALAIKATGCGSYQRTRLDAYGFPRGYLTRQKRIHGFQTGDMVTANVTQGKKAGLYKGRLAVRASGNFNIQTPQGVIQGISHRYCTVVQRADGYGYSLVAKMDVTGTPLNSDESKGT